MDKRLILHIMLSAVVVMALVLVFTGVLCAHGAADSVMSLNGWEDISGL